MMRLRLRHELARLTPRNLRPFRLIPRSASTGVAGASSLTSSLTALLLVATAAACTTTVAAPPRLIPTFEVRLATVHGLGRVLVDGSGLTLYLYEPDHGRQSKCEGFCADEWPPLTLPSGVARPRAGPGISKSLLGTIKRPDGEFQVTYAGWPLYRWQGDHEPGQALGEGDDMGLWYVVSAAGRAVLP